MLIANVQTEKYNLLENNYNKLQIAIKNKMVPNYT